MRDTDLFFTTSKKITDYNHHIKRVIPITLYRAGYDPLFSLLRCSNFKRSVHLKISFDTPS